MSDPEEMVLEARGLTLQIRQGRRFLKVVNEIDFTIRRGEFYALIGESGSGKTMIARAIMRMMRPSRLRIEGSLSLLGTELSRVGERAMRRLRGQTVSMIFQEPMTSLNPIMTVAQQIGEAMQVHQKLGRRERVSKIQKLLEDVQFPDAERVMGLYPHELSGGMRQRVMIAIALANRPQLLIADEPTTALDVTIQQEVMDILAHLQKEYRLSILFISHDLALVHRYADRIGVLYGGVLMEEGPCSAVIHRPAHPYTSALLSCMPRARHNGERQRGLEGGVPRIDNWFEGCRFAPRCDRSRDACGRLENIPFEIREEQSAKCLFPLP